MPDITHHISEIEGSIGHIHAELTKIRDAQNEDSDESNEQKIDDCFSALEEFQADLDSIVP